MPDLSPQLQLKVITVFDKNPNSHYDIKAQEERITGRMIENVNGEVVFKWHLLAPV